MRFQVPQFIEHEPKVIGPLTFKQFIYIGVPAAIGFFLYFTAPFSVFIVVTVFVGTLGVVLAFFKVGGRALPSFLMGAVSFFAKPKHYAWQKGIGIQQNQQITYKEEEQSERPEENLKLQKNSKINNLSTKVETKR